MEQERTPTGPKEQEPTNSFLKYSSFGLQLLGGIGLSGWAGYRLDLYLELNFPVFLLSFTLIAFAGMMYQMYRQINQE
jgi:hypothetical protein